MEANRICVIKGKPVKCSSIAKKQEPGGGVKLKTAIQNALENGVLYSEIIAVLKEALEKGIPINSKAVQIDKMVQARRFEQLQKSGDSAVRKLIDTLRK